ncbi:hypothetical protein A6D6_02668 [Alcanivorax xiamenensis]|uniref:Zinc-ribbon domain-containing protein n=1 Tax=Alcanivorax xiamenensis TaxID=1177156 RepID=A0ABQ6Y6R3_9GAMM|nr:type VI secretion system-associated protein TagO [Alcanivorax xiamenensis]KAF0804904.1 hypothetical protein A6D6_02668 [Alcanivorax xiamenensis]
MALIKCKECGNEISPSAKSCPHCGAPKEVARGKVGVAKIIVIIFGAFFIYGIIANGIQDHKRTTAQAGNQPHIAEKKHWAFRVTTNPIDDTNLPIMIVNPIKGRNYRGTYDLVARCKSNKTELYVKWHDYLGDDSSSIYQEWKRVTVRVGEAKARKETWDISTDKTSTFSRKAIPLLREIAAADKLLLQTTPYNADPVMAVFDTRGLEEPISKIAKECNWKL